MLDIIYHKTFNRIIYSYINGEAVDLGKQSTFNPINDPLLEKILTDLGMIEGASEIYTFLLKKGPKLAVEITNFIGGNKALVYRRLKFLLSKGYIKSTLDYPAR
jgi:hypothetical protein